MISFEIIAAGVLIPIKAQPGARRNGITGEHGGFLKVAVTQAPEKGKANDAIVDVLAEGLKLKRNQISLASGLTSQHKKFLFTGVSAADIQQRLAVVLKASSR